MKKERKNKQMKTTTTKKLLAIANTPLFKSPGKYMIVFLTQAFATAMSTKTPTSDCGLKDNTMPKYFFETLTSG